MSYLTTALEYTIMETKENQERLELNETDNLLSSCLPSKKI